MIRPLSMFLFVDNPHSHSFSLSSRILILYSCILVFLYSCILVFWFRAARKTTITPPFIIHAIHAVSHFRPLFFYPSTINFQDSPSSRKLRPTRFVHSHRIRPIPKISDCAFHIYTLLNPNRKPLPLENSLLSYH